MRLPRSVLARGCVLEALMDETSWAGTGNPVLDTSLGQLDDVTIGNRTRTDDEIAQLYART
jgi:hypothetical protein